MATPTSVAAPPSVNCIHDYLPLAKASLTPDIWQYLHAGSSDESVTDRQNAFTSLRLVPRPLRHVQGGHTRLTLYGQQLAHPLLLAPVSYQRLFHADGECASAMAASAQGGQMLVSSLASQPFAAIVRASAPEKSDTPGFALPWFQLYWQGDRERTAHLLQRAAAAGFSVVVFTVDAPIKQASLQLPDDVAAVNLENHPPPTLLNQAHSMVFDGWMKQAPSWDDVAWLRQQTPLPLLLKGILHPDDAEHALALGCNGIVVSNHGGRVLAGAVASLDVLPDIVQRIGGRVPILFDSGIRSGRDAFVALALGATAVLVGRPYLWGLAAAGALGVAHVIRLLRDELEMTMALTGCAQLGDIGHHCLSAR